MTTGWEELRKEARKLESEIDLLLVSYSKFGSSFAASSFLIPGDEPVERAAAASNADAKDHRAGEIEQKLMALSEVNEEMSKCLSAFEPTNATSQAILQHHRGKLHDYQQDFKKTKANINATREHAELLSHVRQDISHFKAGTNSRMENALRTRGAIHGSDRTADQILGQATEAREQLVSQRNLLQTSLAKLTGSSGTFSGLNNILTQIKRKKSRDWLILGLFISFCTCFILWYWLRS